ncbi:hypothetical protein ILUMI_26965 [Ignelater luminosus]|uniref:Ribosome biogenesis protein NOP53 n=1 Tax=Ignelater luminosus TaxID=2038154 RepID=A0A8K0FVT6_IGNLU|nr:hypothetical protein ILUMI_26965 [Ignelater luminosus]
MSLIKKKRVSKKTKVSWRKHVNIEDVENFLEEQRLEERLGKPISEKTDEELFTVDSTPNNEIKLTSKQRRRLLLKQSLPKCFSMLQPHSEVPDPIIKRNRVRSKEERKNKLVKKIEEEKRSRGILKAKELQSQKDRKLYELKKANQPKIVEFNKDIWNSEDNTALNNEWIQNNTKNHTLRGTGKLLKTVPKSIQTKQSVIPSIEPPHPGISYNPSFVDHQALLQTVVQKELDIIKEEKHLQRVTRSMFSKVTAFERETNWLTEMSEGLDKTELEENIGDYKTINPPVKNKKKDLKQRRKQKEQQQAELARKAAKKEKRKIADIYRLKFLKNQIDKNEKKAEILRASRLKKVAENKKGTKRLSSIKFEVQEIDCSMPQDISGNLRNVKKRGDLLIDRYKSLQKRNILQPTTKHTRVHAKVKRFQKPGHKDNWKITIARSNKAL